MPSADAVTAARERVREGLRLGIGLRERARLGAGPVSPNRNLSRAPALLPNLNPALTRAPCPVSGGRLGPSAAVPRLGLLDISPALCCNPCYPSSYLSRH